MAQTAAWDRTHFFPSHEGHNVLPNSPFFARLLRHAHRQRIAVRDRNDQDIRKTYGDLLFDALALRYGAEQTLSQNVRAKLKRGEEVYVGILAAGSYEFAVAMIAVLAMGAAAVPMTVVNPPEEVAYFVTKAQQVAILCSSAAAGLASSVTKHLTDNSDTISHIDIGRTLSNASKIRLESIVISSDSYLDDNSAGVVIFTSGTTGRPKGSVLRRAYIHESALVVADSFDITSNDILLHTLPVHHATGLGTSFFPFLNSGACIEFRTGSFDPAWVWNRMREGDITVFSGVPTMYMRLMWHYQKDIATKSVSERNQYSDGVDKLRACLCGSSALQQPVQDFWTYIRGGKPILVRYGSSEIPGCIRVPARVDKSAVPKGCVGAAAPGVDVKISDEGELLIKSPHMFSKYLFDEEATRAAHDAEGWFKTGDICRKEGDYYFIIGRASVDIIKSGGYKIGAPEIEQVCLSLPYISEATVVGVRDEEYGERVAAIVTQKHFYAQQLTIQKLRDDMRQSLPAYKLPTLLRIVEGELPKGQTGKVQKKILGPQLFSSPGWRDDTRVQIWSRSIPLVKARI